MRPTALAAAGLGCVVALVGFAGAASASATIDLIWIDKTDAACTDADRRDCPQLGTTISSVVTSDNITLMVSATAGPGGLLGLGVSVDYSGVLPLLSVIDFGSLATEPFLPFHLGSTFNTPPFIELINATSLIHITGQGIGLPAGQSAYIGTVSFHKDLSINGSFEIAVVVNGPTYQGGVIRLSDLLSISATTTFNSAFLIDPGPTPTPTATPTPFCSPAGASCTKNADCCSDQCSGPGGNKVCQPGPTPTATPTPTPEPSALTALGSGIAMLALLYRRRRYSVKR